MRGEPVQTTFVEFEILVALATSPGRVFTRDMLLTRIWGDCAYRDPRTIDVHIRHLREKLERDAKEPEYIFTVRGVGYRFRDTEGMTARGPTLRSLANRLALLFFAITLGAIAVVYLGVTPRLEAGLRDQKLDTLSAVARQYSGPIVDALDQSLDRKVLDAPRAPGRRRVGRARDAARPHARHPGPADLRRARTRPRSARSATCSSPSRWRRARTRRVARGDRGRRTSAAWPRRPLPLC